MEELISKNEATTPEVESETTEKSGKFYTEEEIAMLEQKAGDKRISQYQKTMERKMREADKLRNMNDEDKRVYELEQRELAIAEKEKQLAIAENKAAGLSVLVDKGLDAGLIDYVIDEDAEIMYSKINSLDKLFKKSVKSEIEKRLGSSAPKKNLGGNEGLTKEQFRKMSLRELQELHETSPEVYNALKD